ncbi:MAG: hypothetical protein VX324_10915 [Pseudomonadota bacterium]|uniref:hypothetical protein n=1 Tax=Marinobacter sp. TaxID=50741 RepID=UPI002E8C71EF|nr:hypothetical protein [Pseudomonadota bacterium]
MKRLLIGSLVTALLTLSAPTMADERRSVGWQNPGGQGLAVPPGHQKHLLPAHYRGDSRDRYDHRRGHDRHHKWKHGHRKHHGGYRKRDDRREWHGHRDRHDRYDRHRYGYKHPGGHYRIRLGYGDNLPPEARIGRIIHDTHVLIESNRR